MREQVAESIMQANRGRLWQIIDENSLITGKDMTLSTGASSTFYFDCKKTTLNGEGLALLADIMLEEIDQFLDRPAAIGGLTLGADFIVAAVAMRAFQVGHPTIHGSIVRKEPKKHGTRSHIENEMPAGTKVVVVDDVITTGSSTAKACDQLLANGYQIVGILALVDREAGGAQALEKQYSCAVRSIFKKSDFPRVAGGSHCVSSIPKTAVGA
jgi:orotate phosphoribosyltransferase